MNPVLVGTVIGSGVAVLLGASILGEILRRSGEAYPSPEEAEKKWGGVKKELEAGDSEV